MSFWKVYFFFLFFSFYKQNPFQSVRFFMDTQASVLEHQEKNVCIANTRVKEDALKSSECGLNFIAHGQIMCAVLSSLIAF